MTSKLHFRIFTLLVLCFGLIAFSNEPVTRNVAANQYTEIVSCANTFDGGINNCDTAYANCLATCTTNCGQCGAIFASCFSDDVNSYSNCLLDVTFTLDMCSAARAANDKCNATYNHCIDIAETNEQIGDCMNTAFECRNQSGLDQCQ